MISSDDIIVLWKEGFSKFCGLNCKMFFKSEYPIVDGEPEIPTHFRGNIPLGYLGGISQAF